MTMESRRMYKDMEEFCRVNGGGKAKPLRRILIANNGNAAIKAMRSMRTWANLTFGSDRELEFVVMATIDDIEANAEYITNSDIMVEVPRGTNNNNYANVSLIVQVAEEYMCDAVWPGWGHASENYQLPLALRKASREIVWIGPSPESMIALGDKIGSTIIAQAPDVRVPCVPWSGTDVKMPSDFDPEKGLDPDILKKACVSSGEEARKVCDRIGYPSMLKASEGGGGKGIRKVFKPEEVVDCFRQVVNEVKGSPVFVMKMVQKCRHLEVQMFGDRYGNMVSLGTRDCSIQRRAQKIIEEGNVVAAPPEVVRELEESAVRMAKKVGYSVAGTCEFLYDAQTQKACFCEVNARLQVEHVVTEMTADVNVPAAQLQVAMGIPLNKITDVQAFLEHKREKGNPKRHCIACRVTAEHAEAGFRPTAGAIHELVFRSNGNVWGYFSVGSSGRIHQFADSQFGHIFSTAATREEARHNMIDSLKGMVVRGEIRTNIEALVKILQNEDFIKNNTHTLWLESTMSFGTPLIVEKNKHSTILAVLYASVCESQKIFEASAQEFKRDLNQGQLPPPLTLSHDVEIVYQGKKYTTHCSQSGSHDITCTLNGSHVECSIRTVQKTKEGGVLVSGGFDGRTRLVYYREDTSGIVVTFDGATFTFHRETDPTQVRAPMSGKLIRWLATNDTALKKGQPYAEIEVMKMYMQLPVHEGGIISHVLSEGAVFQPGDLLATLQLPDGTVVEKAEQFEGTFPVLESVKGKGSALRSLRLATGKVKACLDGYDVHGEDLETDLDMIFEAMVEPSLPVIEFAENISVMQSGFPERLQNKIAEVRAKIETDKNKDLTKDPLRKDEMEAVVKEQLSLQESKGYSGPHVTKEQVQPLLDLLTKYENGVLGSVVKLFIEMFEQFVSVEEIFCHTSDIPAKVLQSKRTSSEPEEIERLGRSHQMLKLKMKVVTTLLEEIRASDALMARLPDFKPILVRLSSLTGSEYTSVCLRARQLLLIKEQRPVAERTKLLEEQLKSAGGASAKALKFPELVADLYGCADDSLVLLFSSKDQNVRKLALELYIHRHFEKLGVHDLEVHTEGEQWTVVRTLPAETPGNRESIAGSSSAETFMQPSTMPLLGVFTHAPVFSGQFLHESCDPLSVVTQPTEAGAHDGMGAVGPGMMSRLSSGVLDQSGIGQVFSGGGETRLTHMLMNMGGEAGGEHGMGMIRSQTTICLCFSNHKALVDQIENALRALNEMDQSGILPSPAPQSSADSDARVLKVFVADLQRAQDKASDVSLEVFQSVMKRPGVQSLLESLNIFLITFAFNNLTDSSQQLAKMPNGAAKPEDPTASRKTSGDSERERASTRRKERGVAFKSADLVAQFAPNYLHFRCRKHIPMLTEGVAPETSSGCDFQEESLLRHVETTKFPYLELKRMSNFKVKCIPTASHNVHLYEAKPRPMAVKAGSAVVQNKRYFVRILLRYGLESEGEKYAAQERYIVAGLNALETAMGGDKEKVESNHILMNIIGNDTSRTGGQQELTPVMAERAAKKFYARYEQRLLANSVSMIEVRYISSGVGQGEQAMPVRLVLDNPTGQSVRVRKYVEIRNPTTGEIIFSALDAHGHQRPQGAAPKALGGVDQDYDGMRVTVPHRLAGVLDARRQKAAELSSIYVYDFLDLFEEAVKKQWRNCPAYFTSGATGTPGSAAGTGRGSHDQSMDKSPSMAVMSGEMVEGPLSFLPDPCFEAQEMALTGPNGTLEDVHRDRGMNDIGMVCWRVKMYTPEFPKGRRIMLIANDVTTQMGTFGVTEDLLFQRASEYAREHGIPRVYIAVNSGARMGLAAEVMRAFKIEWVDPENPARGFRYLYLTEDDYRDLKATDSVVAEAVTHPSEGRVYKITDIVGKHVGLGVENLCGSGAIAGETSRAYKNVVTITFCTGRNVGIGAYITRLGQRVIQKVTGAPILLTGYQALNRLIGRDVYKTNDEIGGIDVMHKNGISHDTVRDDIEGCERVVEWLSYIPEHRDGPLPILSDPAETPNRPVEYVPLSSTEDPRLMLTGCVDSSGKWLGGLVDKGSFQEILDGWAKSVICGRARLGGFPIGCILVETRVTESIRPADPAVPASHEIKMTRAGQVWFPDSAYKTAQAIQDFNNEELPLVIFANWRGFSGGQSDMFNEVLKFGSYIVDALVDYKQPCFVYIPPKAELRGGAWVVVDPRINPTSMEMYADVESRGGVLEPSGTVEIKFRDRQLMEAATRLDAKVKKLVSEDADLAKKGMAIDSPQRQSLQQQKEKRLQELLPVYRQVAMHFADMHDTAVRMKKKNAIHGILTWQKARAFFYWRLRRQLILFGLRAELVKAVPTMSLERAEAQVNKWASESGADSNITFVQWATHRVREISEKIATLRRGYVKSTTMGFAQEHLQAVWEALETIDPGRTLRLSPGAHQPIASEQQKAQDAARTITAAAGKNSR